MNRETKNIETPIDKHKIVLKSWISGREKRELRDILLTGMKMGKDGNVITDPQTTSKTEDKAIELLIVSIDGDDKDILNKVLDMKSADFDFLMKEIDNIRVDKDFLE